MLRIQIRITVLEYWSVQYYTLRRFVREFHVGCNHIVGRYPDAVPSIHRTSDCKLFAEFTVGLSTLDHRINVFRIHSSKTLHCGRLVCITKFVNSLSL